MKPVRPDMKQPARNAAVRKIPDSTKLSASSPSGIGTAVEVANTIAPRGMVISAMVLN